MEVVLRRFSDERNVVRLIDIWFTMKRNVTSLFPVKEDIYLNRSPDMSPIPV